MRWPFATQVQVFLSRRGVAASQVGGVVQVQVQSSSLKVWIVKSHISLFGHSHAHEFPGLGLLGLMQVSSFSHWQLHDLSWKTSGAVHEVVSLFGHSHAQVVRLIVCDLLQRRPGQAGSVFLSCSLSSCECDAILEIIMKLIRIILATV